MPIFSYRSLRRMFDDLSPFLNEVRRRELREKIRREGDESVPAEWEIVVGYALSTQGRVSDPGESRPGNPDFLFQPRDTEEQIVCGERLIARWRYTWTDGHVRGVDVFRVRDGLVAEKLSYVKG